MIYLAHHRNNGKQVLKGVQLDPRRFRVNAGIRPTKVNPF